MSAGNGNEKSEEKGSWLRKEEATTGLVVSGCSGVARQAQTTDIGPQFDARADGHAAAVMVAWDLMKAALRM